MTEVVIDGITIGTSAVLAGVFITGYASLLKIIFTECDREHMIDQSIEMLPLDDTDSDDADPFNLYLKYRDLCLNDTCVSE